MGNPIKTPPQSNATRGIGMNHSTWKTENGKTVFFVRHAQAEHNVGERDHSIPDPRLTSPGARQAQRIRSALPADALANVQLVVSSPMRRTIQTTLHMFGRQIEWRNVKALLHPDLQEKGYEPCNTGSPVSALQEEFPQLSDTLELLREDWYVKQLCHGQEEEQKLRDRARRFQNWLLARPEKVIVVVSHNGFLRYLLGDELWLNAKGSVPRGSFESLSDAALSTTPGFANGEVRRVLMLPDGSLSVDGITIMTESINDEIEAVGILP